MAERSPSTSRAEYPGMMTGMFRDRQSAEQAYQALTSRGYTPDDVALLLSDEARRRHFADGQDSELGTKAAEGAGVGAAVGGGLGAILGGLAAVGAITIPGIGLLVMGPLAAALAGGAAGAAGGGLVGALIGYGIPEDRAKEYEAGLREGNIVMGVNPRSEEDAQYFEHEWRNYRGEQIYRPSWRDAA